MEVCGAFTLILFLMIVGKAAFQIALARASRRD